MHSDDFEPSTARFIQTLAPIDDRTRLILIVGLVDVALYLTGVFVAGLIFHNHLAWSLAIAAAGLGYAASFVHVAFVDEALNPQSLGFGAGVEIVIGCCAILAGMIAGIALIFW